MRYVVLGAGAIGSTVGGLLADGGSEVVLLARGQHAAAMNRDGLRLRLSGHTVHVRPDVVTEVGALALRTGDVLLLTTKSQQTVPLLEQLAGCPVDENTGIATDLPLLCLQNGVHNEREALRRFASVYGACVVLPAGITSPGTVVAPGTPASALIEVGPFPARPVGAPDPLLAKVCADLNRVGILTTLRSDPLRWKYGKLLRNLVNSLDAVTDPADDGGRRAFAVILAMMRREADDVLAASGIDVVGDQEWDEHRGRQVEIDRTLGGTGGSSSRQSLARGTGSIESDYLNGEIVLLARLAGMSAPVNDLVCRLANTAARNGSGPGSSDVHGLLTLAREAVSRASAPAGDGPVVSG